MKQLTRVAAIFLALAVATPLLTSMTAPAIAQGSRDSDDETSERPLLDIVLDRLGFRKDLRDMIVDQLMARHRARSLLEDRGRLRQALRERLRDRRSATYDDDDDDDDDGGLRGRLRERAAQWRHGRGGDCYFLTRSLREADGDLLVIVRRRICRD